MRAIYRKIRHARYLYIKRNVEKVWGARYTLGVRYLSKNTVIYFVTCQLSNAGVLKSTFLPQPSLILQYRHTIHVFWDVYAVPGLS